MGTIIVGGAVFIAVCLAAHRVYKDHKNGKSCGNCSGCSGCSVNRHGN